MSKILTKEQILEIQNLLNSPDCPSYTELALKYGVSKQTINWIFNGSAYNQITKRRANRNPWEVRKNWQRAAGIIDDLTDPKKSSWSFADIARRWNVSAVVVSQIMIRHTWRSLWQIHDQHVQTGSKKWPKQKAPNLNYRPKRSA